MTSLFERLGGSDGITKIASDVVDNHLANPLLAPRFVGLDPQKLKKGAATFFISGTGGPQVYEGKDMRATHKGMNADNAEFMAVLEDAMAALVKNNIGQREQEEVLFVFFSMRKDIIRV